MRSVRRVLLLIVAAGLLTGLLVSKAQNFTDILITVAAFVFALLHGREALGWRNTLIFVAVTVAIAMFGEWLSASGGGAGTGITFGHYYYANDLGPKILGIPPVVMAAYFAMGYASLTIARIALSFGSRTVTGWRLAALAAAGSLVMCGWDLAMDPSTATVGGDWVWKGGGNYFGVPIHNWIGWFAVNFLIYAVYLRLSRTKPPSPGSEASASRSFWVEPPLLYAIFALDIVLAPILGSFGTRFEGLANRTLWNGSIHSLTWSVALIAVWSMGVPVLFALLRLADGQRLPLRD